MNMPCGIAQLFLQFLLGISGDERQVFVHIFRDYIDIETLKGARCLIHEKLEALGAGITQPVLDGEAIALRLRNLLAVLIQKQLVIEPFRRVDAQHAADFGGKYDAVDQYLPAIS